MKEKLISVTTTIFCILGLIEFVLGNNNIFLICGATLNIIENIYYVTRKEQKDFSSLLIYIFIGLVFSLILNNPLLESILFCICLEDIISFIGGLLIVSKITKTTTKYDKYFYYQNCQEFIKLIIKWEKNENSVPEFRIQDFKEYDNLETMTARIIFFFNLLLDMADMYNEFRIYMAKVSKLDIDYVEKSNSFFVLFNRYLNEAYDISASLENEPYFEAYSSDVKLLLNDFNFFHKQIDKFKEQIQWQLFVGKSTLEIINSTKEDVDFLVEKTKSYSEHMNNLQNNINENDGTFSYLKILDSEKYQLEKEESNG